MRLSLLAAAAGLVLATAAAQAQIGIYTTPVFTRISNSTPDTGIFAFLGPNQTSRVFYGFGMGFYDDFAHYTSADVGIDVRGSLTRGNGAHLNNFLVGPHISFKTKRFPVKPYLEASIGVGGSRAATNPVYKSKFEYAISGGADYTLSSHVDWRVVEVGVGSVQTISSGDFNGATNPSNSTLVNFSTGLVFRIH
jgi:hypothetical protein